MRAAEVIAADSVRSTFGVVAAGRPLAAEAGAEILSRGGNAVDAAVATAFALAVVEPYASNIGGEGFLLLSLADGTEVAVDYRSRAPLHVDARTPGEIGRPRYGPRSTMVPGMVKGMELALQRYGTMTFAEVLEPAIRLAEEGFAVDDELATNIADGYAGLLQYEEAGALWLEDGLIPSPGAVLRNPDLAHTMRLLAGRGSDVFYKGEIARAIEKATDGWLDTASLAAYEAYEREPVRGSYRGYDILGAPPIVAGVRVQQTLSILEHFDLKQYGAVDDPAVIHLIAEAFKLSRADFDAYVWDPNFHAVPTAGLLSERYAAERARLIDPDRAQAFPPGDPRALEPDGEGDASGSKPASAPLAAAAESASTTHFSVLDKDGNAVSASHTISSIWGSRVVVPGYGFLLSNHFSQFPPYDEAEPDRPDYAAPMKATKTNLSPTIVKRDGRVKFVLGSPGGIRIPTTTVLTLVSMLDFEMDLVEAIRAPKFYADNELLLDMEGGFPEATVAFLKRLGHEVNVRPPMQRAFGSLNVVWVDEDGTATARAALRRPGGAAAPTALRSGTLKPPALITSAGQSSGALMVQVLANRVGIANTYDELASADELDDKGSLIVVVGASMKGLGAAGMDLEQEFLRVETLLDRARREGIAVIAIHIEGAPRRGPASDELTKLAFQYASRAVVRADGDEDGFFSDLASLYDVDLIQASAAADVAGILADFFGQ